MGIYSLISKKPLIIYIPYQFIVEYCVKLKIFILILFAAGAAKASDKIVVDVAITSVNSITFITPVVRVQTKLSQQRIQPLLTFLTILDTEKTLRYLKDERVMTGYIRNVPPQYIEALQQYPLVKNKPYTLGQMLQAMIKYYPNRGNVC